MTICTHPEQEDYVNSIPKFTKKNTLENTVKMLKLLNISGMEKKIIHIAGTNGKGSVSNYMRELLLADGYSVGMFISPHLVTTRERIVINDEMISEEEFSRYFQIVLETYMQNKDEVMHPTFFEFLFLMGMVAFQKRNPDYIILETGMGGRLDATNVFETKAMTIITEIGLDHCQYLGDTVEKIAMEKAGIIRGNVPLVTLSKKASVTEILRKEVKNKGAIGYFVDKSAVCVKNIGNKNIDFSYFSKYYNNIELTISTPAIYQVENVSLALVAHEILISKENSSANQIKKALKRAHWQARMEEVLPNVYVDGAHNEDGIDAFIETVSHMSTIGKRILLFSIVDDKNYEEIIKKLAQTGLFDVYYIAGLNSSRGLERNTIANLFHEYTNQSIKLYDHVGQALKEACSNKEETDILYVVGSLYLAGEVKNLLENEN